MDSNGEPIDADFYRRFWGLQAVFQNPGAHMAPAPWATAVLNLQVPNKNCLLERRATERVPKSVGGNMSLLSVMGGVLMSDELLTDVQAVLAEFQKQKIVAAASAAPKSDSAPVFIPLCLPSYQGCLLRTSWLTEIDCRLKSSGMPSVQAGSCQR